VKHEKINIFEWKIHILYCKYFKGLIIVNPPVVWPVLMLLTRGLKRVTLPT
jgi:hypothetical protein